MTGSVKVALTGGENWITVRIGGVEIYDKLTAAGVEGPELAIAEILERLSKEKLIEIERQVNPEDQEKHGTYIITWVSGSL